MLDDQYKACEAGMTEKIVEMAINSSGVRDTARVLRINKNTVINTNTFATFDFSLKYNFQSI